MDKIFDITFKILGNYLRRMKVEIQPDLSLTVIYKIPYKNVTLILALLLLYTRDGKKFPRNILLKGLIRREQPVEQIDQLISVSVH